MLQKPKTFADFFIYLFSICIYIIFQFLKEIRKRKWFV
nr:MAG TPA: hypothetical protein [Caudoviricetes sp.]